MVKYYTLQYIYEDCASAAQVDIIRADDDVNIYNYLTDKYLEYRKTKKADDLKNFCNHLDYIIDSLARDELDLDEDCSKNPGYIKWMKKNINYEKISDVLDLGSDNDSDSIRISECKLIKCI
jgi:hypothetical protein